MNIDRGDRKTRATLYKIRNIFNFHSMSYNLDKYTYLSVSYTFSDIKKKITVYN